MDYAWAQEKYKVQCCLATDKLTSLVMEDRPIFPDPPAVTVERTLAIIKPDAVEHAEEIIEEINRAGFTILQVRSM